MSVVRVKFFESKAVEDARVGFTVYGQQKCTCVYVYFVVATTREVEREGVDIWYLALTVARDRRRLMRHEIKKENK